MKKFWVAKARYPLLILLGMAIGAYLWERASPWMSAEKFYRNVRVTRTHPLELSFPKTTLDVPVSGQTAMSLRCGEDSCEVYLTAFERQFDIQDRVVLPNGYIPFLREGVVLSDFRIRADVGKISKLEFRKVFADLKQNRARAYRIERSVSDPLVAKVLEMHYLGIPLRAELSPRTSVARIHESGLKILIFADVVNLQPLR